MRKGQGRAALSWIAVALLIAVPAGLVGILPLQGVPMLVRAAPPGPESVLALWSAAWVHLGEAHLRLNLLACGALAVCGGLAGVTPRASLAWLLSWPLTHALLLLEPRLQWYAGASGVLHAGVAVLAVALFLGGRRAGGALLMGVLVVKLARDLSQGYPVALQAASAMPVATVSHLAGAAAGLLCALVLLRVAGIHQARLPGTGSGTS